MESELTKNGITNPMSWLCQFNPAIMIYKGVINNWNGTINVARTNPKINCLPLNRSFAKANPAISEVITFPVKTRIVIVNEFENQRIIG